MQCTISPNEALEELPPKDWTMGRTQIWVIGESTRDHETTPFLRRQDEQCGEKEKEKPTEEKVGQVKPQQGKVLTSPVQIDRELALVASMHNEGPEGPHGESSATCVQWCGWGSCSHRGCIQHAQLTW